MKKIATIATSSLALLVLTAVPALAQSTSTEVAPDDPIVFGDVVTPPSGTAFTGADLVPWLLAIGVLLAVGVGLLVASRRRRLAASL